MYLLDGGGEPASPPADAMQRGTPPRKTVYRISVTMVRKEQLAGGPARRPRPVRTSDGPGQLLEEAEEAAEDSEGGGGPLAWPLRTYRTRSTGQLELGRLRPCIARSPPGPLDICAPERPRSPDDEDGVVVKQISTQVAPLRRSLSFRLGSGPEPPGDPAMGSGGRRHGSSGSLAWLPGDDDDDADADDDEAEAEADPEGDVLDPAEAAATATTTLQPASSEKRNTLDVGEVLSKNDALSDLERWERSKSKNRTLDNSDLQRLERARAAAAAAGAGAASEHRLLRFFSGIFARRDGAPGGPTSRSSASRPRGYFSSLRRPPVDAHSSSGESIDGSPCRGGQWAWWWEYAVGTVTARPAEQRRGGGHSLGRDPSPAGGNSPHMGSRQQPSPPPRCLAGMVFLAVFSGVI